MALAVLLVLLEVEGAVIEAFYEVFGDGFLPFVLDFCFFAFEVV